MKRPSPPLDPLYESTVLSEAVGAAGSMKLSGRAKVLGQYTIRIYTNEARVLWLLLDGKALVGTGRLHIVGPAFWPEIPRSEWTARAGIAVLAKEFRRKGIYSAVLKVLRAKLKMPIESDMSMTAGAIGAWRKAGGELTDRQGDKVFRINPHARSINSGHAVFLLEGR